MNAVPLPNIDGAILAETRSEQSSKSFRFSGHQTFALRMAWIPKAVSAICEGVDPLTNVDEGITTLGLGKNMVESLRCWIDAFQIAKKQKGRWELTPIGRLIFHPKNGLDPYIEDISTPWVLHWLITTNTNSPFFAWECLFNRWHSTEFTASQILEAFEEEANRSCTAASEVTLRQHWEVFLHSYRPPQGAKGEDHLDSVLSILRIIEQVGERPAPSGRWEPLYSFNSGVKRGISHELFAYFIHKWWEANFPKEQTIPMRELILGIKSPARIFKMQEPEIQSRLRYLEKVHPATFEIIESTNLRQIRLREKREPEKWLKASYNNPHFI